jgi:hypothetical protein
MAFLHDLIISFLKYFSIKSFIIRILPAYSIFKVIETIAKLLKDIAIFEDRSKLLGILWLTVKADVLFGFDH